MIFYGIKTTQAKNKRFFNKQPTTAKQQAK